MQEVAIACTVIAHRRLQVCHGGCTWSCARALYHVLWELRDRHAGRTLAKLGKLPKLGRGALTGSALGQLMEKETFCHIFFTR